MPKVNSWLIERKFGEDIITVSAHYVKPLEVWGLQCRVNGRPVDFRQASDPTAEGLAAIEAAILNGAFEKTERLLATEKTKELTSTQ
jgi:hypothetical protein